MAFDPLTDFFISDGLPQHHNSLNNAGPIRVLPEQANASFYICVDKRGNQLPVWQVGDGRNRGGTAAIWAYWCPYDQDRFGWTALGKSADVMFTATMDGCSFGIGQTADGTVIVGHVNSTSLQDPTTGDTSAMERNQKQTLRMMLQSGTGKKKPAIFEPKDYRYRKKVREVSATTFGVREQGKWRFYAHRWVKRYQGFQVVYDYLEKRIK